MPRITWSTAELIKMRDWIERNCPLADDFTKVTSAQQAVLPDDRQRAITHQSIAQQAVSRMQRLTRTIIAQAEEKAPAALKLTPEELAKLAPFLAKGTLIELA